MWFNIFEPTTFNVELKNTQYNFKSFQRELTGKKKYPQVV